MDIENIIGVGPKVKNLLKKLNINTILDMQMYYPFRYEILKRSNIKNIKDMDRIIYDGMVVSRPTIISFGKKIKMVSFRISNEKVVFNVIAYNRVYLMNVLKSGSKVTVIGKYNFRKRAIILEDIRFELLPSVPQIESVYYTTTGLSRRLLGKIIMESLKHEIDVFDFVPSYLKEKYNFIDKKKAIKEVHLPNDLNILKQARLRLKYEELFLYMLRINYLKKKIGFSGSAISRNIKMEDIMLFVKELPFSLTVDQLRATEEIIDDLNKNVRMNRLLQGDVGSGKTIVAFIASYGNYLSGYQTAIMVPTEILAKQHYDNAIKTFKNTKMKIDIITSSTKLSDRKKIYKKLEDGDVDLIIGTQSLIQESVNFNKLGFVITDEQHRFGVNQRQVFKNKGLICDVLSMSATPIPRTYALTIYGDIDVSNILEKPVGRRDIVTYIKYENEMLSVLKMMQRELELKHQIYVVVPLIDEEDDTEKENISKIESRMKMAFGKIALIKSVHGKLSSREKDKIMSEFSLGSVDILISTTVIEVGVDVRNATMMIIFDANFFGLSTIHQLRGRVGRGTEQSYCILISKVQCERLKILEETNDGFKISEYDFKNRGEGDLFGTRQSGDMKFNIADIRKDYQLLVKAKDDVNDFLENYLDNTDYVEYNNRLKKIIDIS